MRRLIDIAGRTGQLPVRSLLSAAVGSSEPDQLQPHEIRYRNDQHRVIYGLYDGDDIVALIGLVRNPAGGVVEIRHLATQPDRVHVLVELVAMIANRHPDLLLAWKVPAGLESAARAAGFQPSSDIEAVGTWVIAS